MRVDFEVELSLTVGVFLQASVLPEEECIIEDVLEEEMSLPGSCDGSEYNGVVSVTATVTRVQSRTSSRGSCRAALSSPGMSTHGVSPLSRTGSGAFEAWSVNGAAPRQKNTTSPPGKLIASFASS